PKGAIALPVFLFQAMREQCHHFRIQISGEAREV
ncbi:hypothetical protein WYG_4882, partial [Citrobacter sp. A1]